MVLHMIIYLKFTAKNVEIKIANLSVILLGLKIINYFTNATNVKKRQLKPINVLIKKFSNTNKFCTGDINKFTLLLKKDVYPYENMDSWERFDKTLLPDKKSFYSEFYLEDITDKDYTTHAPVVTFSSKDNTKLLLKSKSTLKRAINWNKYLSDPKT